MIPAHATDATGVEDKPDPEATYPVTNMAFSVGIKIANYLY